MAAMALQRIPAAQCFSLVYSNEGPRGPWRDVVKADGSCTHKRKVLVAGRIQVVHNMEGINAFLTRRGLPFAEKVSVVEEDDLLKECLELTLDNETWESEIKPVQDQFQAHLAAFTYALNNQQND